MKYNRFWFSASEIKDEHKNLKVNQVYCWLYTADGKILIVSKDNKSWQLPGGHPHSNETNMEAMVREISEETGININGQKDNAVMFGYYVIEEIDDNDIVKDKYLQVRYFLPLKIKSNNLPLFVNENPKDTATAHIKYVEAVDEEELLKRIVWMKQTGEYKTVKKYFPCVNQTQTKENLIKKL